MGLSGLSCPRYSPVSAEVGKNQDGTTTHPPRHVGSMARPSMKLPPDLIAEWEAGALSSQALSTKYGIARRTIESKLKDIPRDPTGARRAAVRVAVSGLQDIETTSRKAGDILREETDRDVVALSLGARNALGVLQQVRALLDRLEAPVPEGETAAERLERIHARSPKALHQIAQANSAALESWRRARDLDDPTDPQDMIRTIQLVQAPARADA